MDLNMKIGLAFILGLGVLAYILFSGGFIYQHYILFSPVSGVVQADGAPLQGIKITRLTQFTFNEEIIEDVTTTDSKGQFSFSEIKRTMFLILPHEPMINQDIYIDDATLAAKFGRSFSIRPKERKQVVNLWMFTKRNYDLNSEYKDGIAETIVCNIDAPIGSLFDEDPEKNWISSPKGKCRLVD